MLVGKLLFVLGGVALGGGMLLLSAIGVRRFWKDLGKPRDVYTSSLDEFKRDVYEPLAGRDAWLARLAVPMLAVGAVLLCIGILLS